MYFVYILECSDGTLYTGITTDLDRRLHEHNHTTKGAKYTRARRPVKFVYHEIYENRSEASKRELLIKKMKRQEKIYLVES